jgi:hypothetical protein
VGAAVAEFHLRDEGARLIEARAQEPIVRGIRLTAVGKVDEAVPVATVILRPGNVGEVTEGGDLLICVATDGTSL